jgi:two-component system sensor histidine kinase KdpD
MVAANLALIFVITIVAVAGGGFRGPPLVAAVVSGLSFDYFCTVPYLTLRMSRGSDITTTLLLVAVGLIVGQIATGARRARTAALSSGERLERVHALGERIAAGHETADILAATAAEVTELLSLRDCQYVSGPMTRAVARIQSDGSVIVGERVWSTDQLGLPTQRVALAVRSGGFVVGTFVLTPTPGVPVEREQCLAAVALADQLGAALAAAERAG